jgi:hypothetical protein
VGTEIAAATDTVAVDRNTRDEGAGQVHSWTYIPLGLGSALVFAISSDFKHRSASQVPNAQDLHPTAVRRLITATLSHPLWLGGAVADVIGLSLQIIALHLGPLAVVQPLLISGLLFALLLRQRHHDRISGHEVGWAVVLVGALVGFLVLGGTADQSVLPATADRLPAIAVGVTGFALAVGSVAVGRQQRSRQRAAAALGVAVGAIYAATAALLKSLSDIAVAHPGQLVVSWQLYTVVVLGGAGLLLNQIAFQAGPLTASLPAISTVDPLLSIAIGVIVYDERIRHGPLSGLGLVALLVVLGIAVIQLARRSQPAGVDPERTRDGSVRHPPHAAGADG